MRMTAVDQQKLLNTEIGEQLRRYSRRRARDKWKAAALKMAAVTLAALTTVLLEVQGGNSNWLTASKNIALVLAVATTVVNAYDAFSIIAACGSAGPKLSPISTLCGRIFVSIRKERSGVAGIDLARLHVHRHDRHGARQAVGHRLGRSLREQLGRVHRSGPRGTRVARSAIRIGCIARGRSNALTEIQLHGKFSLERQVVVGRLGGRGWLLGIRHDAATLERYKDRLTEVLQDDRREWLRRRRSEDAVTTQPSLPGRQLARP
jgi:hypothetical protein